MAVYGGGAGRWAGWICALDPLLVLAPAIESVAALALATATLATAAWIKTPRPGRALGVGMLWGIGALAHPALLALPLLMAAWAWVARCAFGFAVAPLHPFDPWLTIAGALLLPFWLWGATRAATGARRLFQSVPVVIAAWFLARTLVFGTTTAARVPVEPMLALLAAVGLDDARRRARAWSHGLRVI